MVLASGAAVVAGFLKATQPRKPVLGEAATQTEGDNTIRVALVPESVAIAAATGLCHGSNSFFAHCFSRGQNRCERDRASCLTGVRNFCPFLRTKLMPIGGRADNWTGWQLHRVRVYVSLQYPHAQR